MSEPIDTKKLRELAKGWTPVPPYVLKLLLDELDAATAAFKDWQGKYNAARAEVVALSERIQKLRAIRCSAHNGWNFARYLKDHERFDAEGLGIVIGYFELILELLAADDAAAKEGQ